MERENEKESNLESNQILGNTYHERRGENFLSLSLYYRSKKNNHFEQNNSILIKNTNFEGTYPNNNKMLPNQPIIF